MFFNYITLALCMWTSRRLASFMKFTVNSMTPSGPTEQENSHFYNLIKRLAEHETFLLKWREIHREIMDMNRLILFKHKE
jgi:hypothetical protein